MDEKDKTKQRERYERALKRFVGHEEQKSRKAKARQRKLGRTARRPREREWDEEEASFEKIPRARGAREELAPRGRAPDLDLPVATVVAVHHGRVELDTGASARIAHRLLLDPQLRLAVGDEVHVSESGGQARVEALRERRTRLSRPDPGQPGRELVLAANVDRAIVVAAVADPPLRPGLIDRFLLALEDSGIEPAICVNKIDLLEEAPGRRELDEALAPYREMGVPLHLCSAESGLGLGDLRASIRGKTCAFVGHSGVGKSSLLNAIDPEADRRTGGVRAKDGKGRHTTSWSSLRELGDGTRVIDTPGIRAFGLERLEPEQIRAGFTEFAGYAGSCRFADCTHVHEPGCAVRAAVESGAISAQRFASYLRILESC